MRPFLVGGLSFVSGALRLVKQVNFDHLLQDRLFGRLAQFDNVVGKGGKKQPAQWMIQHWHPLAILIKNNGIVDAILPAYGLFGAVLARHKKPCACLAIVLYINAITLFITRWHSVVRQGYAFYAANS